MIFVVRHLVMSDSETPWTAAHQASLALTISWSLLKFMSIASVIPSSHLILCRPLLLLPSIFLSIRPFPMSQLFPSGDQIIGALVSASVLPMSIHGWFPLRLTGLISCTPGDSQESSPAPQFRSTHSLALLGGGSVAKLGLTLATPWTTAHQASLSITNSWSLPKLMSIESVMPSNHLILCRPLLLLPSIFPSTRVFSNESALCIRWPNYWSFSFNNSPSNEHSGLISFRMDWLDLLAVQ